MGDIFISEFLGLDEELDELGVFDALINKDSHFFVNLLRLKHAQTPEFANSYKNVNYFFYEIMLLLDNSHQKGDKLYRTALSKFHFSEVNGINLGFSESSAGSGFGAKLSKQVINDAFDIVKSGSKQPEIFQLVGLFEENVAADRLSDMIATLILSDIKKYTQRINADLGITPEKRGEYVYKNGIIINPYKNCELLYLPKEILHELPIARCWDDIDRVMAENKAIRDEVNEAIGNEWRRMASDAKKAYLRDYIFKDIEKCARVISGYREDKLESYTLTNDIEYFIAAAFKTMKKSGVFNFLQHSSHKYVDSMSIAKTVLDIFKGWVENNKGWELILDAPSSKREKVVQKLIQLSGKKYCEDNDYDFTFEPNEGPGPADVKISRGAKDKTIIEVKLNTNQDYLHGYEEQIQTYVKAENTKKCIYVYVKVAAHPQRDKKIIQAYEEQKEKNENAPLLVVVDSQEQVSASVR